jgi:hypothetical protein
MRVAGIGGRDDFSLSDRTRSQDSPELLRQNIGAKFLKKNQEKTKTRNKSFGLGEKRKKEKKEEKIEKADRR